MRQTHIVVDGREVLGVECFRLEQRVKDEQPRLTLWIVADQLEIDGDVLETPRNG